MSKNVCLRLHGTDTVLAVDADLERRRFELFMPLIDRHGGELTYPVPFDHLRYKALSPTDRCFDNAMETALRHDLRYFEGVVMCHLACPFEGSCLFPLAHGWCVDRYGRIVDPTLSRLQDNPAISYLGVAINKGYSVDWKRRVGYYGCLDGDKEGKAIGVHHEDPALWLDKLPSLADRLEIEINCKKEKVS